MHLGLPHAVICMHAAVKGWGLMAKRLFLLLSLLLGRKSFHFSTQSSDCRVTG